MVTNVENDTVVDCHMENKQKTITFKFDISDVIPSEVANKLIAQDLLSEAQETVFTDMIKDIVRQVKMNPNKIPSPSVSSIRGNMKKVRHGSLTRPKPTFRTHQRNRSRDETSTGIESLIYREHDFIQGKIAENLRKARSDDIFKKNQNIHFLDDQFIKTTAERLRTRASGDPSTDVDQIREITQEMHSRKTSTSISEYTSFSSDCTPENTLTSSSTLDFQKTDVDKSSVDTDTSDTVVSNKMERKVSRFLVSPVAPIDKRDSPPMSPDVIDHVYVLQDSQTNSNDPQLAGSSTRVGPERTSLELLKIGLENITHAHVPSKVSQCSLGSQKSTQPSQQADLVGQGDNSINSMSSMSQSTSVTATSSAKGSSVYNSRRTSLDNSVSDLFNINTPTNLMESTAAQTPSECSSDYSSSGSGRKLSKQGSLDQTKDSILEGSLANLQQKLSQLTSAPSAIPTISQIFSSDEPNLTDSLGPISAVDTEGSLVSLHQKLVQITSSTSCLPVPNVGVNPSLSNEQLVNVGISDQSSEQNTVETQRVSAPAMLQLQDQSKKAPNRKMSRFSVSLVQENASTISTQKGVPDISKNLFVSSSESEFSTPNPDHELASKNNLLIQAISHTSTPTEPIMQSIPISYTMTPSTTSIVTSNISQQPIGEPHSSTSTTIRGVGDELLSLAATNADLVSSVESDIKLNLDNTRKKLCNLLLETNVRSRLVLLLQRQRIEEDELRLKHITELETFESNMKPHQIPQTSQGQQWHQTTTPYLNTSMQPMTAVSTTYQSNSIQQTEDNPSLYISIPQQAHQSNQIQSQVTADDSLMQLQTQVEIHPPQ